MSRWFALAFVPPLLAACELVTANDFDVSLVSDAGAPAPDAGNDVVPTEASSDDASVLPASLALGASHTCAAIDGGASCWGRGLEGQLGDGNATGRSAAAPVTGLASVRVVGAGGAHSCAVLLDGTVSCWGDNDQGQTGQPVARTTVPLPQPVALNGAVALALVDASTCALLDDGTVRCWGANASGQLGNGSTSTTGTPTPKPVTGLTGVTAISGGGSHFCALTAGTVRCWGLNHDNQLGDDTMTDRSTPISVPGISGIVAIAAGARHTCALGSLGAVSCWGANDSGQLGDGSTSQRTRPTPVIPSGVLALAAGDLHTCATFSEGVRCWGHNVVGQLGTGTHDDSHLPSPSAVPVGAPISTLAAGGDHTCVVTAAGNVACWGSNADGELGNGSAATDSPTPVKVTGL